MHVSVEPADAWSTTVAAALNDWLSVRARPRLCLAVGSTPEPVYRKLAPALLSDATVFLVDEFGGLPVGDPGRCASTLWRGLLERARLPASRFLGPNVDAADIDAECGRYEQVITDGGLDLVVLGLGTNGHVGMNEPGSDADTATRVVQLAPETREAALRYGLATAPTWGITVGMRTLLAAREVWLLVTGRHKRAILHQVLTGAVDPSCPASLLRTHPNAWCWADDAALPRRGALPPDVQVWR
jgi:6-phosphogluconolactonase/glucosamine-6-phosphate isomerase/deaminase